MKKTTLTLFYVSAFLIALVLLTIPFTMLSSHYKNTLQEHPDWGVSKCHIATELMGTTPYKTGTQALADNQLHLEAWHGYHEVMYRKGIVPRSISFSFFLAENSWLSLIFNRPRVYAYDVENYCALRLSTTNDKPDSLLQVSPSGEFLTRTPLDTHNTIIKNAWNECSVVWNSTTDGIDISINGQSIGSAEGDFGRKQHIGFRGGAHVACVDNIHITEKNGARHSCSFAWHEGLNRSMVIRDVFFNMAKIAFAIVISLFLLRLLTKNTRTAAAITLSCCATVLLTLYPWVLYHTYIMVPRYPVIDKTLRSIERTVINKAIKYRQEEFLSEYSTESPVPENTVMLIGTSQTWGCGATHKKDIWAKKLEKGLNKKFPSSNILFLNGAIKGATSDLLYPFYEDFLCHYPHKMLFIVLGCNDFDGDVLHENLGRFITLAQSKKIATALIVEALSYEQVPNGTDMLPVMISVAKKYNVPLFNMHEAVKEYQDAGFFWWDVVHPTSFGHDRISHVLTPFFEECLGLKPESAP
ncbi:MAG: SGNH/GDSL hydrolase family protein [Candidatus Hydrogenedentes bacterium]|nr:SGNH/GDSL hydrolase family protein [Candidatus Hydrogenedentota bacterium]